MKSKEAKLPLDSYSVGDLVQKLIDYNIQGNEWVKKHREGPAPGAMGVGNGLEDIYKRIKEIQEEIDVRLKSKSRDLSPETIKPVLKNPSKCDAGFFMDFSESYCPECGATPYDLCRKYWNE